MGNYEQVKRSLYFKKFTRTASSFETALWNCFDCADDNNQYLLGQAFPVHLKVFNDWYGCIGGEREYFKEYIRRSEPL